MSVATDVRNVITADNELDRALPRARVPRQPAAAVRAGDRGAV